MSIQRINPNTLMTPGAPYHAVVRKGNVVTTAGQIAFDAQGNLVGEGDIAAQTRQTLENVKNALEGAGATLDDVVKTTVFITDFANFKAMNEVYGEFFGDSLPARSTVGVQLALPTLLVEIEAMAVVD